LQVNSLTDVKIYQGLTILDGKVEPFSIVVQEIPIESINFHVKLLTKMRVNAIKKSIYGKIEKLKILKFATR
jgi:hypothetical protein